MVLPRYLALWAVTMPANGVAGSTSPYWGGCQQQLRPVNRPFAVDSALLRGKRQLQSYTRGPSPAKPEK